MQRLSGYPRWFFAVLIATLLALLASGLWLLPSMLEMRLEWEVAWRPAAAPRVLVAATHTLAGFVTLIMIGALMIIHMRGGWRLRLNHISGCLLLALFAAMLLSAVGIFYAGDEFWSRGSSVLHTTAGLLGCVIVIWHVCNGARVRRRLHQKPWQYNEPYDNS